jgi:ankyrin repeat protein
VAKLLLKKNTDVNAQGGLCCNALQAASVGGHEEVVKLLLNKGADVNAQGRMCHNALYAALERGHEQVVKLLLDKGADVNAQGELTIWQRTPGGFIWRPRAGDEAAGRQGRRRTF